MLEVYCIRLVNYAMGEGFHQLGYGQYASHGVGMQHVKRGVAVNE